MYATTTLTKESGKLIGVHQRLDKIARNQLAELRGKRTKFPTIDQILRFEGTDGPDGIKRKSADRDVPWSFLEPGHDDGKLITQIMDHHHNLAQALRKGDKTRAAFEAAWMAHDVVDGLTPPHHYPYMEIRDEILDGREPLSFFGIKTRGLMPGKNVVELFKNNWVYIGTNGLFTRHAEFEMGAAFILRAMSDKSLSSMPSESDLDKLAEIGFEELFRLSVARVATLNMYARFLKSGWDEDLALETKQVLLPEMVKCITLAWLSATEVSESKI